MAEALNQSGSFLPPSESLPSPAPSNFTNTSQTSNLPHPRSHPLRAGSEKEQTTRRYVENDLLRISRRYIKRFNKAENPGDKEDVDGYMNMKEVATDLGSLVDVLWLSGTPTLQISNLLTIAGNINYWLPSFPPAPVASFTLLKKLDHAFSSLLKGKDSVSGETLPGFGFGNMGMSRTEMVRCKNLVEATRVAIVEVLAKEGVEDESEQTEESEVEKIEEEADVDMDVDDGSTGNGLEDDEEDNIEDKYAMDVGSVYEKTIWQLGILIPEDTFVAR